MKKILYTLIALLVIFTATYLYQHHSEDWIVYDNENLHYSVSFPPDWHFSQIIAEGEQVTQPQVICISENEPVVTATSPCPFLIAISTAPTTDRIINKNPQTVDKISYAGQPATLITFQNQISQQEASAIIASFDGLSYSIVYDSINQNDPSISGIRDSFRFLE